MCYFNFLTFLIKRFFTKFYGVSNFLWTRTCFMADHLVHLVMLAFSARCFDYHKPSAHFGLLPLSKRSERHGYYSEVETWFVNGKSHKALSMRSTYLVSACTPNVFVMDNYCLVSYYVTFDSLFSALH